MFFQPELEAALDRHACAQPRVTVERGWVADGTRGVRRLCELTVHQVSEDGAGQLARTGERRRVRARWLVGADGANSFVRKASGIARRDLGFQERWLVVDAEPNDMGALAHLPIVTQRCDPARPTTIVQSGPRHRRWEFMLLPDERSSDFEHPERVWALLEPWYRPQDGPLTRSTVYEFRSMVADRMRHGRVLIAGDAAHLTPPFLGQGLCSGLRDAANMAWKLNLVLRGVRTQAAAGHDRGRATAAERGGDPARDRAGQGPLPARPPGRRGARQDAARRRAAATARACAADRRPAPPADRRARSACRDPWRPGSGESRRNAGTLRRCRRARLPADRRRRRPARASLRPAAHAARHARGGGRVA